MKALLLAAGLGTRLRPLTDTVPKCLVEIHGKPLLAYWLDMLFAGGIERVLVNTHHLAERVQAFWTTSRWNDRVSLVHEPELLGTGGTMLANAAFFAGESFLVGHADNLTRFSVRDFVAAHERRPPGAVMTMMTFDTDAPETCGIVETDNGGVLVGFHEKVRNPPGRRANAAVYIVDPRVVDYLGSLQKSFIDFSTEVIPNFIGRIAVYHNSDYHRDIGSPESLALARRDFIP